MSFSNHMLEPVTVTRVTVTCETLLFCAGAWQVFQAIRSQVTERLSEHSNPDTKAVPGAAWVKGWGTSGALLPLRSASRGLPPGGNQCILPGLMLEGVSKSCTWRQS